MAQEMFYLCRLQQIVRLDKLERWTRWRYLLQNLLRKTFWAERLRFRFGRWCSVDDIDNDDDGNGRKSKAEEYNF